MDREQARQRGRIGGHVTASRYDARELSAKGRQAFWSKFEREVDPEGVLPEPERLRRAEHARKAHFARMALKSAEARCKKKARRENALKRQQTNE